LQASWECMHRGQTESVHVERSQDCTFLCRTRTESAQFRNNEHIMDAENIVSLLGRVVKCDRLGHKVEVHFVPSFLRLHLPLHFLLPSSHKPRPLQRTAHFSLLRWVEEHKALVNFSPVLPRWPTPTATSPPLNASPPLGGKLNQLPLSRILGPATADTLQIHPDHGTRLHFNTRLGDRTISASTAMKMSR
jgi:hypothetical protein